MSSIDIISCQYLVRAPFALITASYLKNCLWKTKHQSLLNSLKLILVSQFLSFLLLLHLFQPVFPATQLSITVLGQSLFLRGLVLTSPGVQSTVLTMTVSCWIQTYLFHVQHYLDLLEKKIIHIFMIWWW